MTEYDIYAIGNALVDTEIEVTDQDLEALGIEKGIMTLVDEQRQQELLDYLQDHLTASRRASGGSAANTVIAASYFGAKTFYSCKVADDDNGLFYRQDLQAAGVDHHPQPPTAGVTGKCLVMITPDAERSMNTFLGISETVSTTELHPQSIAKSRFAYLEGYLVTSPTGRAAAISLRNQAQQAGANIALSLSDPAMVEFFHDGLLEMIGEGVDLLFCNEAEALRFTRCHDLDSAMTSLRQYARSFAITRGAEGAVIFDGNETFWLESQKVVAVDTNGAGDMFAGAFLFALCRGDSYRDAGRLAIRAAAAVVSRFGPRLPAPLHQQLLQEA